MDPSVADADPVGCSLFGSQNVTNPNEFIIKYCLNYIFRQN